MNGVIFYFSGTGNTHFIADKFAATMRDRYGQDYDVHSIEEHTDFRQLMQVTEVIGFCYPIYGSSVPKIMRQFALRYNDCLAGKRLILLCTQFLFSGDGARAFTELLKGIPCQVILAEHIPMPNNLCNFPAFPVKNGAALKRKVVRAERRLERACKALHDGRRLLRGFHSRLLGLTQRPAFLKMEQAAAGKVRINGDRCIRCGRCVRECPTGNLSMENGQVESKDLCTLCYRCVNRCPEKAINVWIMREVMQQYYGLE